MNTNRSLLRNKNAAAWVLMISAIAVHVFDETVTDFLPFYNDIASNLRGRLGFFLPPRFTFGTWMGGLIVAIVICFALTPLVNRCGRFIRTFTTVLAIIMVANALGHMLGSVYLGRLLPGFWSSPFLLLTAVFVVIQGFSDPHPTAGKAQR
ncbi:MAG: HXXEE domain-containing protein [Candidatus Zixiibacteriota bacterium]